MVRMFKQNPARRYSVSRVNELKSEYKAGRKDLLINTIQKMSKQLNQRFYRLEKANVGLGDSAYRFAQKETGKIKPRYTLSEKKLKQMSINDLYDYSLKINIKLMSDTSTIRGVRSLYEENIKKAAKALSDRYGLNIDPGTINEFIRLGGSELLNDKSIGSPPMFELIDNYVQNGALTMQEFISILKDSRKPLKFTTIDRKLTKLSRGRRKRR